MGSFNISDALDIMNLLFEKDYMSVSCVEKKDHWTVEILNTEPIEKAEILDTLNTYNCTTIETEKSEKVDWLQKCFESFKPITVAEFYIYGPHLRDEKKLPSDKICIEIAAATAFGSGEHPTTNRCLAACSAFFDRLKHKTVLDLGCGSCILGIALVKLGAESVIAYDNDPEAVRVSLENVILNKVDHRVSVFLNQDRDFTSRRYDFIVANILAEPLIDMSDAILKSLSQGGILVLSGFTSDDSSVLNRYESLNLKLIHRYDLNDWTTLVFEKL